MDTIILFTDVGENSLMSQNADIPITKTLIEDEYIRDQQLHIEKGHSLFEKRFFLSEPKLRKEFTTFQQCYIFSKKI